MVIKMIMKKIKNSLDENHYNYNMLNDIIK